MPSRCVTGRLPSSAPLAVRECREADWRFHKPICTYIHPSMRCLRAHVKHAILFAVDEKGSEISIPFRNGESNKPCSPAPSWNFNALFRVRHKAATENDFWTERTERPVRLLAFFFPENYKKNKSTMREDWYCGNKLRTILLQNSNPEAKSRRSDVHCCSRYHASNLTVSFARTHIPLFLLITMQSIFKPVSQCLSIV